LQNILETEVETTLPKEPPPKPPEHIVDKAAKLDIASSQPNEGESKGKTIAELTSMHISKFEEDHNGEVDKEGYYIDNKFLDASLSSTNNYNTQMDDDDDWGEDPSCTY
jgi:hypothetical protein